MTDTLALATATTHGGDGPAPLTVVIAIAAIAYVLWNRTEGRPLKLRRMLLLPAVLGVIGITDLTGSSAAHLNPKDIAFLLVSVAISAALGAARGATIELYSHEGELWQRYKRNTVLLWILLIASKLALAGIASSAGASAGGGTNSLLLSLGVSLLAEAAIVGPRALSTGVPFAASRDESDRGQYRMVSSSTPSAPQATHVDSASQQQERPHTQQVDAYLPRSYKRRSKDSRRHRSHSGPIHRLVGQVIDAQARSQQRTGQQGDPPEIQNQ